MSCGLEKTVEKSLGQKSRALRRAQLNCALSKLANYGFKCVKIGSRVTSLKMMKAKKASSTMNAAW